MSGYIGDHEYFFFAAILVLSITIILRSKRLFLAEILLVSLHVTGNEFALHWLTFLLLIIQTIFLLFLIFAWIKAIERNYQLVLEKTHQIPRTYTKNSQSGSVSDFVFNKLL